MIRLEDVCKSFDGKLVTDHVSAEFLPGKVNMTIGQSGSGKTVLLKSIVGLHPIDEGKIWYDDLLFNQLSFKEMKEIRKRMGMLFQGSALFDFATVEENVMFPLDLFTNMSRAEKRERANACLKRVNVVDANKKFPNEISGGMQKRVAIARAMANDPRYLFCDEPNSGLDPKTSILIDNLIKEITEEYQITTIVNTHDMNSIMEIGDKIIFIYEGKKWWEGSKDTILHSDNKELNDFVFASNMAKSLKKYELKKQ